MMMKLRGGAAVFQIEVEDGKEWRGKRDYARNAVVEKWKMSATGCCAACMGYCETTPGGRSEPVSWFSMTVSGEANCICFIYGMHQIFNLSHLSAMWYARFGL